MMPHEMLEMSEEQFGEHMARAIETYAKATEMVQNIKEHGMELTLHQERILILCFGLRLLGTPGEVIHPFMRMAELTVEEVNQISDILAQIVREREVSLIEKLGHMFAVGDTAEEEPANIEDTDPIKL